MILAVSRFRVVNGFEGAVRQAFLERPRLVDDVRGFLGMEVCTDAARPADFYLMTRWTDEQSFLSWHGSDAHKKSHVGIPRGLRLDPTFTQTLELERIADPSGAPRPEELSADLAPLLARYLEDAGSVCLLTAAIDGTVTHATERLCALLGLSREAVIGKRIWDFLPDPEVAGLRDRVTRGERGFRERFFLNFVDTWQVPHTLDCRVDVQPGVFTLLGEVPVRQEARFEEEMLRLNNEVSVLSREHARQSRTLAAALASLKAAEAQLVHQEKMAALGRMTAGVAHEINNPVAFVRNDSETLRRDIERLFSLVNLVGDALGELERSSPAVAARIVAKAAEIDLAYLAEAIPRRLKDDAEGLDRIARIVLDLRKFSRLDECEVKPADISETIRGALRFLTPLFEERGVRASTDLPDLPPLPCSPGHLNQAVSNVLANAAQASSPGQEVRVSTAHRDGQFVIAVEDDGVGITPANISKIFDPFFTTKPVGEGTGLGLSIAHQILQAHHGEIRVRSTPGSGTRVELLIPLPAADANPAGTAPEVRP